MSDAVASDRRIDAGETKCGELLMMMHQEMKAMRPGEVLDVCAYSAGNLLDIPAWCRLTGHSLLSIECTEPAHFYIRKKG